MASRVDLHIGLPKTATTSLQTAIFDPRGALADAGIELVVDSMRELFVAARDLGYGRGGAWGDLAEEIAETPGRVLLSCEGFAAVSPERAAGAVRDLAPAEVHVVCTLRDPARVIPSVWQQHVRTGALVTLPDFVERVRDGVRWTWLPDPLEVLDAWTADVPADRVKLVTVPPAGASAALVGQRFAAACELDADLVSTVNDVRNASLGPVEIEVLRLVNAGLGERRPEDGPAYRDLLRPALRVLALHGSGSVRLGAADHAWAVSYAESLIAALSRRGFPVYGDLDELMPTAHDAPPSGADPGAVAALAAEVAAEALLGRAQAVSGNLERSGAEGGRGRRGGPGRRGGGRAGGGRRAQRDAPD